MKAAPRTTLVMIQAQFFLHWLVALLHRPAALPEPNRLDSAGARRQVRERILDLAVGPLLDQQPQRFGARTGAFGPTLPRPGADPGALRRQLPQGPLTPGHLTTGQAFSQGFQAHRSWVVLGQMGPTPGTAAGRWPCGPVPTRLRGDDHHLRGHPRDVEPRTLFPAVTKGRGDPVARIGDDDVAGQEFLVANLIEQVQGDRALGPLRAVLLGDTDLFKTRGSTGPGLGDVEPPGRGEVSLGADVVDGHGHLAVGLLAQLAAGWALHADGVPALFGVAGIVDDEDPARAGQGFGHHTARAFPDLLLVPGALVDELLQGLFGVLDVEEFRRPGDTSHHRLDALAVAILEQATEGDATPGVLSLVAEVVPDQFGIIPEPIEDFGGQFGGVSLVHTGRTNKAPGRF